jgi:hypothetical protein
LLAMPRVMFARGTIFCLRRLASCGTLALLGSGGAALGGHRAGKS